MNKTLMGLSCVFIAFGICIGVYHCSRYDPGRHVSAIEYPVRCRSCDEAYTLSTADMHALIKQGKSATAPEQMRRFSCRACGEIALTLEVYTPDAHDETRN